MRKIGFIGLWLLVVGCAAGEPATDTASSSEALCSPTFDPCGSDADCCKGNVCWKDPDTGQGSCFVPPGSSCASDEGCFPGTWCVNGQCGTGCASMGSACQSDAQCCDGTCQGGQCACVGTWDPCQKDADCCAGNVCWVDPNGGSGTCFEPEGSACSSDEGCVPGTWCVNGQCGTGCASMGNTCESNAQCCTGNCQGGQCTCVGTWDYCDSQDDCCPGNQCFFDPYTGNGACFKPAGSACETDEGCAPNTACVNGVCTATCSPDGDFCESDGECCSGACAGGTCASLF